ncbi:MAG TPA: type II secretion system protein GspM [Syntrophales bacterium]|nr:type II secretion system protein GspM [Syntrophales bacterium]HPQ44855.1 type II secretion system protein GspM [Syntrophales bacterium]
MKISLTRERKYILIGGAILLFFGFVYWVFPFLQGIYDGSTQIEMKEKQLAKYQRTIGEGEELKQRLTALTAALDQGESGFLKGRTSSLAAVDIQNILNAIAAKSDVEIQSKRVLKAEKQDDTAYLIIPVKFSIVSTMRQLKEILYGIEASDKNLMVREMRITVPRGKGKEQLRVDMTVAGFMKGSES